MAGEFAAAADDHNVSKLCCSDWFGRETPVELLHQPAPSDSETIFMS